MQLRQTIGRLLPLFVVGAGVAVLFLGIGSTLQQAGSQGHLPSLERSQERRDGREHQGEVEEQESGEREADTW